MAPSHMGTQNLDSCCDSTTQQQTQEDKSGHVWGEYMHKVQNMEAQRCTGSTPLCAITKKHKE